MFRIDNGQMKFPLHPGQREALERTERFVIVLAGTQSGKTVFGPVWLLRAIWEAGGGDHLVVAPSYPLMEKKVLPAFLNLFQEVLGLGAYHPSRRTFEFSLQGKQRLGLVDPCQVFLGYATKPESLESATARSAWLDEVGQKGFQLGSWEAIQRRLSIFRGRVLFTTTPYNLGWFKQQVCDRAGQDPDYALIRFPSTANPAFPREEMERAERTLPAWKFRMFYLAEFSRPAGLVYDCFREESHVISRFEIPAEWPRFLGLDFGGVNTAGVFYAQEPGSGKLYLYRTYQGGGRTAAEHVTLLRQGEPDDLYAAGGSASEEQWRQEFRRAGLYVRQPPVRDVAVGIQRVYAATQENRLAVFSDQTAYLDEKMRYARILDEKGNPTEEIEDPHAFHLMDAERYILSYLWQSGSWEKY